MTTLQILFGLLSLTACSIGLPYTKTEHLIRPRDVSHSKVKRQTLSTSFSNFVSPDFSIQLGCAAALICVEEEFCTMDGTISTNRIQLDDRQILQRVPLSSCRNPDNGVIGKCCRDPNYVDPWPAGNLPANYSGGFDEQGFPTFLNIAKLRPTKKPSTRLPAPTLPPPSFDITPSPGNNINIVQTTTNLPTTPEAPLSPDGSGTPEAIIPIPSTQEPPIDSNPTDYSPEVRVPVQPPSSTPLPQYPLGPCGIRNDVPRPINLNDPQAAFAEIPWQAMILSNSQKKILCSGALVSVNVVVTAARCVDRIPANDVSVKLGEWKLGYELKHEEPLPFEIVNVSQIEIHPNYSPDLSSGDMAVLFLEHPVMFDAHVNPICLTDVPQIPSDCIVTGWGKVILEENLAGAIMNKVDVEYLPPHSCEDHLAHTTVDISMHQGAICAKVQKQRNNMCQVDVGGPMTCTDSNGFYNLVGVYSQDTGCLPTNQVATFAPVDMAWLNATMHGIRPPKINPPNEYPPSGKELVGDSTIQQETLEFQKSNLPPDANQYLPPQ